MNTSLQPVSEQARIESLDVLRGFALLGILAMNIYLMGLPFAAYTNPTIMGEPFTDANKWTYIVVHMLFDLKMITIFAMLFGAGALLYADKAIERSGISAARWLWLRRMGWLALIGLLHAYVLWEGDILFSYAFCGIFALWWLRRLPIWALLLFSVVLIAISQLMMLSSGYIIYLLNNPAGVEQLLNWGMTQQDIDTLAHDLMAEFSPTQEMLAEQISIRQGSYAQILPARAGFALQLQTQILIFFTFWRVTGTMLLGMVFYRLGFLTGQRSNKWNFGLAIAGYGIGVPIVIAGILFNSSNNFDPVQLAFIGQQFNSIGSIFVAFGHIGFIVSLVNMGLFPYLRKALAAVGQMALTNYLLHSLFAMILFQGWGVALFGKLSRLELELVVIGIWSLQLIGSPIWLSYFRFGPAEWLWRSLTYFKLQPMRLQRSPSTLD